MFAAATESTLSMANLFATIPFWPLLGAMIVAILIANRANPERAHLPVIGGVAISAILSILMFFTIGNAAPDHGDSGHAAAAGVEAVLVEDTHGGDAHARDSPRAGRTAL